MVEGGLAMGMAGWGMEEVGLAMGMAGGGSTEGGGIARGAEGVGLEVEVELQSTYMMYNDNMSHGGYRSANTALPIPALANTNTTESQNSAPDTPPLVCVALLECDVAAVQSATSLTLTP